MKFALVPIVLVSSGASAPRPEARRNFDGSSFDRGANGSSALAADAAGPRGSVARASDLAGSAPAPAADLLAEEEPGRKVADPGRRLDEGCAPEDLITCDDGLNGTTPCEVACEDQCCKGTRACDGFTGAVCKDGASCVGVDACRGAAIGSVTRGCSGEAACLDADINSVTDGCDGTGACAAARIDSVRGGCIRFLACSGAGYDPGAGVRNIGYIRDSCEGDFSCRNAARESSGGIATIWKSCNAEKACQDVGREGDRTILEIADCCNTAEECKGLNAAQLLDRNCTAPSAPPSISSPPSGVPTPVPGKSSKGRKSGKSSGAKGKGKSSKHGTKGKSESIINLQYIAGDASMSMSMSFDFDFDIDADTGLQQVPRERAWG